MYKKIFRNMCLMSVVTLLLSTVLILSACYTAFSTEFREEIKNECQLTAQILNAGDFSKSALEGAVESTDEKRISIISPSGELLYDSSPDADSSLDYSERPEVSQAVENGFGEDKRRSETGGGKYLYYAVRLNDGSVLRLAVASKTMPSVFFTVLIAVLFTAVLIYIISVIFAMRLTENIVKPIENIYSVEGEQTDSAYEEIRPFLSRIARQNEEINRQMAKVKSQKARLQAIMDNINEGLLIADNTGEILTVNSVALEIFEKDESSVKYKNYKNLTDREEVIIALGQALSGEKSSLTIEKSGRSYQIFCSPVHEKGRLSGTVMLIFDVSGKIESEKIRREFTANVSHELKTPLTAIHGYAQIIGSGIAKPDDIIGFVKKIERESSRLIALVDDIIKLSHLDESAQSSEKHCLSLKSIVAEALDSLNDRALERGITIEVCGEDTQVYANLSQAAEMVYNLVDNAVKYNRDNGSVKITISEKQLTISDTGIGIPEKYFERIFERFFRVDKSHSKKVNGTGLGLSIVKHLAAANDASVTVKSKLGEGTEFTVKFSDIPQK